MRRSPRHSAVRRLVRLPVRRPGSQQRDAFRARGLSGDETDLVACAISRARHIDPRRLIMLPTRRA
ncbi:hypothetical protein OG936_13120 [Streptomyces sp. NBC_00846]|uniref:hypothetical protein n=1 Tax=Streptomyces sp. NBC_00846 TaxID=2975849 RepID=UPI003862EA09|nr:hypothetical protein OG936_13120 [Streptomyces sp. NBC_00846]